MTAPAPILDVRHLSVEFKLDGGAIAAVDDVSFQVPKGQTVGIVGESGSGKSVTSLAVMGLVPSPPGQVTSGELWFRSAQRSQDAVDLARLAPAEMRTYRGREIAMIFQEPMSSLNPVYTCGFQLTEALRFHTPGLTAEAARQQAIALLQEVRLIPSDAHLNRDCRQALGLPADAPDSPAIQQQVQARQQAVLDRYPHELSGGQIQRVMIAMAISCNPSLLIADEPTTALDVTVQATILDLLRELRDRRQMSMIFITHDLGIIAEIADVVVVMYRGQVVETGRVLDIFANPQHPYTKGLLACRPRPDQAVRYLPTVADFMASAANNPEELVDTAGRSPQDDPAQSPAEVAPTAAASEVPGLELITPADRAQRQEHLAKQAPILRVEDLTVTYPVRGLFGEVRESITAVDRVSFLVHEGETLGLVGESGCGKTTLSRALLKLIPSRHGQIFFDGRDITQVKGKALRRLRRDLQIVFQDPFGSLDPRMSVGQAIAEPLKIHQVDQGARNRRDRVAYLLDRVGLDPSCINRYPHEFSGGQRQRICIARSLALNPRFIICDESVSALDVSVQAQVLNLLKELQTEFNLTYIFISHDLSVVQFMSDRIMVMNQGRIAEIGAADQIYHDPQEDYTRQLIAAIPVGSLDRIQAQQAQRSLAHSGESAS